MMPRLVVLLLMAMPLGGCVAGIAASAAGMAIQNAKRDRQDTSHLQPMARSACSAHAAQHGEVHIIDVEQRSAGRIIVWGTVTDASGRRSFECAFTDRVAGFKLRAIRMQN